MLVLVLVVAAWPPMGAGLIAEHSDACSEQLGFPNAEFRSLKRLLSAVI